MASAKPAYRSIPDWHPAGPGDVRSPCPGLNIAANHGFLPHDGKQLTEDVIVNGLFAAYNIDRDFGKSLFKSGILTTQNPSATSFTLEDVRRHGIIEHDASLTRADSHWGDNYHFNLTCWLQTRKYWTEEIVTPKHIIHSRFMRELDSATYNPVYEFTDRNEKSAFAEAAAPMIVLGDKVTGETRREWMDMFFLQEKLPYELGWTKKELSLVEDDLNHMVSLLANVSTLRTDL